MTIYLEVPFLFQSNGECNSLTITTHKKIRLVSLLFFIALTVWKHSEGFIFCRKWWYFFTHACTYAGKRTGMRKYLWYFQVISQGVRPCLLTFIISCFHEPKLILFSMRDTSVFTPFGSRESCTSVDPFEHHCRLLGRSLSTVHLLHFALLAPVHQIGKVIGTFAQQAGLTGQQPRVNRAPCFCWSGRWQITKWRSSTADYC